MLRRPAHVTRRRVAAHACPDCHRLWALRGVRTDSGAWLILCAFCGWSDLRPTGVARDGDLPSSRTPQHDTTGASPAEENWVHAVLLYAHDDELLTVLEDYLLEGWARGAVGLVIATPEHRRALRARLDAHGVTRTLGAGRLVELDAATTLEQFMRDGAPDAELFHRTVGSLVRDHAADGGLRGFGEMVDVLWADGNAVGALQLERLWAGLQDQVSFTLLCAYTTKHVDAEDRDTIAHAHDRLLA